MESISHSLPKRSFSSNSNGVFTSQKSVYDDVFGGPPKFGIPTLAPRLEDYSEIFGGFHASRSSSIPVLHLPLIAAAADNLHLDVRSPGFDYTEVFGDFGGLDFTASFDDLVGQSSGGYDSSDEPWSPAQSGSLSDELDPPNGSDNRLSDGDAHQSLASIKHFNASYNKSIQGNVGAMLTGTAHVADYSAVPGDTFPSYESSVSWNGEDDQCSMHVIDDINCSKEFGERIKEEKPFKKCLSYPLHSGFNTLVNDFSPFEKHGNSISPQDKPFITVSDISLQTKPSRLPPPSRPPPALVVKKGECGRSSSKLKASKSYAFDRVVDDSASLFFDVEVDASVSAEGRKNGNKNIKVMHESTQESIERKDIRSPNAVQVEEKTDKIVRASCNTEDDKMHRSHGKETSVSVPVIGDRMGSTKSTKETLGFRRVGYCNHIADNSAEAVARKEATEYFEVNEKDDSDKAFYMVEDYDTSTQMHQDACRHRRRADLDTLNPREDSEKLEVTKETPKWDEASNQCEMTGNYCDWGNKQQKEMQNTSFIDRKRFLEKIKLNKQTCVYDLKVMIPENTQQLGESEKLQIDNSEIAEGLNESKGRVRDVEAKLRLKASPKRMDIKKNSVDAQVIKRNGGKHKKNILMEECQRGLEDVRGAETRERVQETTESEGIEKQHCVPGKENESKLKDTHKLKENDVNLKEAMEHGQIVNKSCVAAAHEKNGNEQLPFGVQEDKERLMEAGEQKVIKLTFRESLEQVANDKEIKLIHKREVIEERNIDALVTKDNDLIFEKAETRAGSRGEVFETKGNANLSRDAVGQEELSGHTVEIEPTEMNGHEREVKWDLDDDVLLEGDQLKLSDGGCKLNEMTKAKVSKKHDNILMLEVTQAAFSSEGNRELKNEANRSIHESEVGKDDTLGNGNLNGFSKNKDELQDRHIHCEKNITMESPCLHNQMTNSNICGSGLRVSCVMPDNKSSELVDGHEPDKIISTEDDGVQKMKTQFINKRVDARANFIPCEVIRESLLSGRKVDSASSVPKHTGDTLYSIENSTSQRVERKDKNMKDNIAGKDQKIEERIRREIELENEHIRKLEEERERVREREKDRMAVNKAALEARERSYIEARERAERAAVERATAEARQRAMTGTRERLEKASMEARLRTERAAVERANAEARQRAAEKSMTQKATSDARDRVENSFPDRFSAVSRPDTRQSTLSSDLQFQSTSISNGLRYSYTSAHVVVEGESPQRCKARLERYRRTAERAASALAEKNRRDLLAQREREERNRVAEVLDAEVRRWSSGKEGNLRALLSTLQYILGPDSGWQPVPLTEVITSAAVKKAYRKATLCVHPDKLQQRGATIQHKYICGKVFDLLKEAWNKFNSEER